MKNVGFVEKMTRVCQPGARQAVGVRTKAGSGLRSPAWSRPAPNRWRRCGWVRWRLGLPEPPGTIHCRGAELPSGALDFVGTSPVCFDIGPYTAAGNPHMLIVRKRRLIDTGVGSTRQGRRQGQRPIEAASMLESRELRQHRWADADHAVCFSGTVTSPVNDKIRSWPHGTTENWPGRRKSGR
jgi:hypothetical protein